jgi:Leucine-rich repeat (LRR) protein
MTNLKRALLAGLALAFLAPALDAAIPAAERAALIAFYNSTSGDAWRYRAGWKTPPLDADGFAMPGTEGNWFGVTTASDHVTTISFYLNNNLDGSIPAALGDLTDLQVFRVHWNGRLTGSIPAEMGSLTSLQTLDLWDDHLTGAIPPELGGMTSLQYLDLSDNYFTGAIPPELGNLANLQTLKLSHCQVSGSIPPELGKLTKLTLLNLYFNQLTGSIPAELGNMTNVQELTLSQNQLTGSIPVELGNLASLRLLDLDDNQLTGSIPAQLGQLASLENLWLHGNQLTGSIPTQLGNLADLEWLWLADNRLTGSIPDELGNLTKLSSLYLGGNQLTGTIPPVLGSMASLAGLSLNGNQLTGSIPPELGNRSTGMSTLGLGSNQLTGTIPAELGNLTQLEALDLSGNHLSGAIPSGIGNLTELGDLALNGNMLGGEIPASFTGLWDVFYGYHGYFNIAYNALYSTNASVVARLDDGKEGWNLTQTVAPVGVAAATQSAGSILVSWTPIAYTGDSGGYRVYVSTSSGGPYTHAGTTASKSAGSFLVTGLNSGTTYWFVVRTRTNPHSKNSNPVISDASQEVSAATTGPAAPAVDTSTVTDVTWRSAVGAGNVTAEGAATVTGRGICWSTNPLPTLADSHTTEGPGVGAFFSQITGLSPDTTYHVRAYATSSVGTAYGNEVLFTTLPRPPVTVALAGTRKSEQAWLITRHYGELQVTVANPGGVAVATYVLQRRAGSGSWTNIQEISPASLQNNSATCYDRYLEKKTDYTYRVQARDDSGSVLAVSAEVPL